MTLVESTVFLESFALVGASSTDANDFGKALAEYNVASALCSQIVFFFVEIDMPESHQIFRNEYISHNCSIMFVFTL